MNLFMTKILKTNLIKALTILVFIGVSGAHAQTQGVIHHSLKVRLDPYSSYIEIDDTIVFPSDVDRSALDFLLNSNLSIEANSGQIENLGDADSTRADGINSTGADTAEATRYQLSLSGSSNRALISYKGNIYQAAAQDSAQYSQSFSETSGIITDLGVYLNGASLWVPNFSSGLITFDLQVEFLGEANEWTAISQGSATGENQWAESNPMEEIYLIAAQFTQYISQTDGIDMLVYLRNPDPNLAAKYLDATERYLALYEPLLGDYPFDKFALIENFWETGYGMPSFTLLGQQIIRFPFIIDSSYPHEILHNWWGNGVYPDYESGNWSEGLTAYLADHLFQEMNGLGHEYRKDNLIRYKNYVAEGSDFPLREFISRDSAASQAVGYGKTLMLWHMLRLEIGDELFLAGLRQLYSQYKFQSIGFNEISQLFSELVQQDLQPFFSQWVDRTGAPQFQVSVDEANNNQARIMFTQIHGGEPYQINMPVALFYAGREQPEIYSIALSEKFQGVMAENYDQLQAIVVDPFFDVFRQLDREEIPPVIGQLFGAPDISFVVPLENREHWMRMAEAFGAGVNAQFLMAEDLESLPVESSVWILGKDNPFASVMADAASLYDTQFNDVGITLAGSAVEFSQRSSVLTARHPANDDLAIGWIHVDDMIAMPGMIEKLPHYGKYSFLSFIGDEPTNDVKGIWTSPNSPMQWMAADLPAGYQLPELSPPAPLAELPPKYLPEQLQRHVLTLASDEMQGRAVGTSGAEKAASYIAQQFRDIGLQTLGGSYLQQWIQEIPGKGLATLQNVVGIIPGSNPQLNSRPVIIGAHYDHLGSESGTIFNGADDNASGVSVMIEVAAKLTNAFTPARTIIFVAFDGEESGLLGSTHFVTNPPYPYRTEELFAMVNLDSVGRLEGRDLQVFGSDSAYEWPFMAQGIGFTIGVGSTMVEQVIASSDHVSFLNAGIPAIHLFSGVHTDYHQSSDSVDKLDLAGMSNVALWLEETIVFLADREAPLRVNLEGAVVQVNENDGGTQREASLGTVPDFAYSGDGIRISDVSPGGAAEAAGLLAGDILLRYNNNEIGDLQTYSNLIRQSSPDETVELIIRRQEQQMRFEVTLKAR
jgi:hypothetical protein